MATLLNRPRIDCQIPPHSPIRDLTNDPRRVIVADSENWDDGFDLGPSPTACPPGRLTSHPQTHTTRHLFLFQGPESRQ